MATFAKPGTTSISAEEVRSDMDGSLPPKRMPELTALDEDNIHEVGDDSNKKRKHEISSVNQNDPLPPDLEDSKGISGNENSGIQLNKEVEEGEEDEDDEDEEDYEDDDDGEDDDNDDSEDEDDELSNGGPEVIDRKSKGILKDEKGKGKLIEESDDSSDYGTQSDGDSDLSDDPLADVNLDNILPSRTRRRAVLPGVHISNDRGSKEDKFDDGDDSTS